MDIKKLTQQIDEWVREILRDNYVGVYFHGSLRLGSFNPEKSDLDFIIVAKNKLDSKTKELLWDKMLENLALFPKKGFEFSVVLEKYCKNIEYPTPYELHGSRDWIEKYQSNKSLVINDDFKVDYDLASHFNVINVENEEMDFGAPSDEVFAKVPMEFVIDSNYRDVQDCVHDIVNNPVYSILNLCRFYALVKEGITLSKYDGGKWAMEHVSLEYGGIIYTAISDYAGSTDSEYDDEELKNFASYMMGRVGDYVPKI